MSRMARIRRQILLALQDRYKPHIIPLRPLLCRGERRPDLEFDQPCTTVLLRELGGKLQ